MKTETSESDLMQEATEWRLISLLFECPVDGWIEQVKQLADEAKDPKLKKAAEFATVEASEGIYHSIFGPGGPAPGREVSYRSWVEPGYMLSELSTFYNAFSYELAIGEVPDHVAVETGFIAYLRLKELYARTCGDDESANITAEASGRFAAEHITKYAQKLKKLLSASGIEYLQLTSAALFERVGPDKDKELKTFLPVIEEEDESLFDCGASAI